MIRVRSRLITAAVLGGVLLVPLAWIFVRPLVHGGGETGAVLARAADQDLLANSIWLGLTTTLVASVLGVPLGLATGLRRFPLRIVFEFLLFLPLLIPAHIHAIAWARVTGDRGWFTAWIKESFGIVFNIRAPLGDAASDPILGHIFPGPSWVMGCAFFPLIALSLRAGCAGLDAEGIESARQLGGRASVFRRVILPQLLRPYLAGALFVFLLSLATYPVVSLLDTPTLIQRVVFTFSQVDQTGGAILALPLVIVALATVVVLTRAGRELDLRRAGVRTHRPERGGILSLGIVLGLLVVAAGVPLWSLLKEAGPLRLIGDGPIDNYQSVVGRVGEALRHSLGISSVAVVALLVLSWPLGRTFARKEQPLFEALSLALVAFPPVVVGVALVLFFGDAAFDRVPAWFAGSLVGGVVAAGFLARRKKRGGLLGIGVTALAVLVPLVLLLGTGLARVVYEEGIWLVVLALVTLILPFTARILRNGFLTLDPDEAHAAALSGHGGFATALKVEFPRMLPSIVAAALVGYVLSFTELAASLMTLRPGWQSVQVRIFNMVHYQSIGEVSALCLLVILMALVPIVLAGVLLPRRKAAA